MGISLKPSTKPSLFDILRLKNKIDSNFLDINNKQKIEKKILKFKPDLIFHLAISANKVYNDPLKTWSTNLFGSINF